LDDGGVDGASALAAAPRSHDIRAMPLPPGFLDELRARVPLSAIVGRRVTWDRRKSNPARGDFWACCPFHQEKSPSFHVDDRQGFYYCFGCHAKGDAVSFLREQQNLSFREAVEELARAAGLEMPKDDPRAAAAADRRRDLAEWMEAAVRFYRARLAAARGEAARRYLDGRGVGAAARERFDLGYAPGDRRALTEHLSGLGAPVADLVEAGLSIAPEDGGQPFDRFRDRLMFPIRDPRGRCIAFGGRAMSAEAQAKYLNSPETPLFDKSRTLYNAGPAREAAAKARTLIVAEGYMDVIALVEAGFGHAVAPLGTAITEHHLAQLWRIAAEPVIALDGDAAGRRAALRAIDLALPLLEPGRSLRFALLPGGRDPDDLIRAEGPGAMRAVLETAEPLAALLWRRETEGLAVDDPDSRARLVARLRAVVGAIRDPIVRTEYEADFAARRAALFGRGPRRAEAFRPQGRRAPSGAAGPSAETRASALARGDGVGRPREAALLLALINHPWLARRHGDDIAALDFVCRDLDAVRGALLFALSAESDGAVAAAVSASVGFDAVERLGAAVRPGALGFAARETPPETAEAGFAEALARLAADAALRREVAEAEAALAAGVAAAETDGRLRRAVDVAIRDRTGRIAEDASDEARLSEELRNAISRQIWVKRKNGGGGANR
jgi:DNA primase